MEAYTKKMILLISTVFVGLAVSSAFARRYDTMIVGYDRWIDIDYKEQLQDHPQKDCSKTQTGQQLVAAINCSNQDNDPNTITYQNYQDYEPNSPDRNDPNTAYYPWPPDPNDLDIDPNDVTEEKSDPNDNENKMPVILDYGIAKKVLRIYQP